MVDVVENAFRTGPGRARGPRVCRAVLHVAQMIERVGLIEGVCQFPVQVGGLLVAGDGLLVAAELMVNVAETVPGRGLPVALPSSRTADSPCSQ